METGRRGPELPVWALTWTCCSRSRGPGSPPAPSARLLTGSEAQTRAPRTLGSRSDPKRGFRRLRPETPTPSPGLDGRNFSARQVESLSCPVTRGPPSAATPEAPASGNALSRDPGSLSTSSSVTVPPSGVWTPMKVPARSQVLRKCSCFLHQARGLPRPGGCAHAKVWKPASYFSGRPLIPSGCLQRVALPSVLPAPPCILTWTSAPASVTPLQGPLSPSRQPPSRAASHSRGDLALVHSHLWASTSPFRKEGVGPVSHTLYLCG